ncbi:hypothetical protein L249_2040 [Ophiocordyceps polyrhachis-furcata BCC 54312]|uniref:1,3-beta-glucanosyltransferase n=1 Tax=Ophiocordyceps polyrhachis-furcata BCC 54312 TaxID=1330021 RepID=A0A367LR59_9HYPO|nr:hypothetical protein L249_2040 [Ophiocordyceps polyrhachis-furcata BCC 54312]
MKPVFSVLLAAWSAALAGAGKLPPVEVRGTAFVVAGQDRFYIRGIDYQPGGSSGGKDPLANPAICRRDIEHFAELGINTIRVYMVDNSRKHDECMKLLDEAGIYLILDVNNPGYSINRADPHKSYNTAYLKSIFATVNQFARYNNTLAFFSGNEVINDDPGSEASAPYVKAVTRDIKNYLRTRGFRAIPVGYSAADVELNAIQVADYMNCGSDDMRSDFFAFNDYSFCNSDFETSRWREKVRTFSDYGIPILYVELLLSEYGCIQSRPRKFDEMAALMSPAMTSVYSGGLLYEYSEESNNYGIVRIKGDAVEPLREFDSYRLALEQNPPPAGDGGAAHTTHARACPTLNEETWDVDPSLVPEMPSQAERWMKAGITRGPGLRGGSQEAADSGTASRSVTTGKPSPIRAAGGGAGGGSGGGDDGDEEDAAAVLERPCMTVVAVTGLVLLFGLLGVVAY